MSEIARGRVAERTNVSRVGARRPSSRAELLQTLATMVSAESLDPVEAAVLAVGRMDAARFVGRRVWIRHLVEHALETPSRPRRGRRSRPAPPRPAPGLSRLNRSQVNPRLVSSSPPSMIRLAELLAKVHCAHAAGMPKSQLLDALATGSGSGWEAANSLLGSITGESLTAEQVAAVKTSRQFWTSYAEGRARLAVLERAGEIRACNGNWAYFDRIDFAELLPGVILPDHHERAEFLTNYCADGAPHTLDVYSINFQPLFRHEFGT